MSEPVVLPALGESVTEGTVTRWLKQLGDRIEVDEPLLEVSTDKVDTEIPSPVAGVLEEILVQEDETAEVGAALARIGDGSGVSSSAESASSPAAQPEPPSQPDAAAEPGQSSSAEPSSAESAPPAAVSNGAAAASNDAASVPEETGSEDRASQDGATQDVVLPSLGESITEGTVTRWLKAPGDRVAVDEPLLEVSTDKVDTEVPSPVEGVVQEILAQEDETVEVGAALARIATGSGGSHAEAPAESKPAPRSAPPAETPAVPEAEAPSPAEPDATAAEPQPAPAARSEEPARSDEPAQQQAAQPRPAATPESTPAAAAGYVTPIVRKLAHQLGVDIATVTGRGVGGRIRKEDVQEAADRAATNADSAEATAPASSAPAATISELRGTTQKMSRLRKVIAERAVASLQATAQLTTVVEVDVTRIAQLRQAKKEEFLERSGNKLSFLPFFALAAAEALRSHPIINATVDGEQIVYPDTENISIAVDTERGLLTPVVRDAGEKNIAQLAADIADLARRTRENTLTPDELSGGTFTITNTGSRGALFDTPLVFMPQVAILGTGTVVRKPVVVSGAEGDAIAIRSIVYLALSYDHRIVDGADAARFLTQVKDRLEAGDFTDRLGL